MPGSKFKLIITVFFMGMLLAPTTLFAQTPPKADLTRAPIPDDVHIIDVAIVGGGISGLYAGYRLVNASPYTCRGECSELFKRSKRPRLDVQLFEMSDRLGGRIWTMKIPGTQNLIAELGATRFLKSHSNIYGLARQELKLLLTPAVTTSEIQFFRGHYFREEDYKDKRSFPQKVPYFLAPAETGYTPFNLLSYAAIKLFPDLTHLQSKDLDNLATLLQQKDKTLGQPLYAWGAQALLAQVLSPEGMNFVLGALPYRAFVTNNNAYDFFVRLPSLLSQDYFTVVGGMQNIPAQLAQGFSKQGGVIYFNTKLYTFDIKDVRGETVFELKLGAPQLHEANKTVLARSLVLAMPKQSLQLLRPTPALLHDKAFSLNMNAVTTEPFGKIFLVYDQPWWQNVLTKPAQIGQSNTDMPLQKTYYLGFEKGATNKALILASYHDGVDTASYWRSYFASNVQQDDHVANYVSVFSEALLTDLDRQLAILHRVNTIPRPTQTLYMDWSQNPYGGGLHYWKTQVKPWEIIPYMRHPFKAVPLYIIGEAYSSQQGWLEGAINSAEKLMEDEFGLPRAPWIPEDYNL